MMNADQLRRLARARNMPVHAEALAEAGKTLLPEYGITSNKDVAAFWATIANEMGGFKILEENLSYTAKRIRQVWPSRFKTIAAAKPYARNPAGLANKVYGGRLGNKGTDNAGWLYRGSGPLQTTGKVNFEEVERETGIPVVADPDILRTDVETGLRAACIFWKNREVSAPATKGDIRRVRKIVNGGYIGFKHFEAFYKRALGIIEREGLGSDTPKTKKSNTGKVVKFSEIIPPLKPQQSAEVTRAVIDKYRHLLPDDRRDDAFVVLGVKGYYSNSYGKPGNDRAVYDDARMLHFDDGGDGEHLTFNSNLDPSRFRSGIATARTNQAIKYKPGPHGYKRIGGPYPAFRQAAKCWVHRDGGEDQYGIFWINDHAGGDNNTSSAGCLTTPRKGGQWDEYHAAVHRLLKASGQKDYFVILVEYAGGNPPVTIKKEIPVMKNIPKELIGPAAVGTGYGVWEFWDSIKQKAAELAQSFGDFEMSNILNIALVTVVVAIMVGHYIPNWREKLRGLKTKVIAVVLGASGFLQQTGVVDLLPDDKQHLVMVAAAVVVWWVGTVTVRAEPPGKPEDDAQFNSEYL